MTDVITVRVQAAATLECVMDSTVATMVKAIARASATVCPTSSVALLRLAAVRTTPLPTARTLRSAVVEAAHAQLFANLLPTSLSATRLAPTVEATLSAATVVAITIVHAQHSDHLYNASRLHRPQHHSEATEETAHSEATEETARSEATVEAIHLVEAVEEAHLETAVEAAHELVPHHVEVLMAEVPTTAVLQRVVLEAADNISKIMKIVR